MKKTLIALALTAAPLTTACSAKDSARLVTAIAVADVVVEMVAPVADEPQAPASK